MSRYQLRLLLSSLTAIGLICLSAFVMHWFTASVPALGVGDLQIGLREARACGPNGCAVVPLGPMKGAYPTLAGLAFWCSIPLLLAVVVQCGMKVVSGIALELVSKAGYAFGAMVFMTAFAAGFLFNPEGMSAGARDIVDIQLIVVRTSAPLLLVLGSVVAMVALRYAVTDASVNDDVGEYKPVVVERKERDSRLPVTPLSNKIITPGDGSLQLRSRLPDSIPLDGPARPRTPTSPPLDSARPKSPTNPPIVERIHSSGIEPSDPARPRTPSQQPLVARTNSPGIDSEPARPRSPSQQPLVARTTSPGIDSDPARPRSPSQQPLVERTKSPSQQPLVGRPPLVERTKSPTNQPLEEKIRRSRTSSTGPIDIAARLGASMEVAIRPPLPEPVPVPPDQIAVAPESGLTIRKRTPSAGPLAADSIPVAPESGLTIRKKSPSQVPMVGLSSIPATLPIDVPGAPLTAAATDMPSISVGALVEPTAPVPIAGTIRFAVTTLALTSAGLDATYDDGRARIVKWNDIVGVVARRFPPIAPYDGATFVDVVSTAGATLRMLPSTVITGHALDGSPEERAREFVHLVAAQCLDAKLDAATNKFSSGGSAAQLPDTATLEIHDQRLA